MTDKDEPNKKKSKKNSQYQQPSTNQRIETLPTISPTSVPPGFNLTGRSGIVNSGIFKSVNRKVQSAYHPGNLTTDSFWHFRIDSAKGEWIRVFKDSISAIVFAQIRNAGFAAMGATEEERAEFHSCLSQQGLPVLYLDPTVMGACFVKNVSVSINNVPVESNCHLQHIIQYVRMNRIFNEKPDVHFKYNTDLVYPDAGVPFSQALFKATEPFDYRNVLRGDGVRIPIYMDSVFPFDLQNLTCQTLDKKKENSLFLPPESQLDIRISMQPNKMIGLFNDRFNFDGYMRDPPLAAAAHRLFLHFTDACIEYESAILTPKAHLESMKVFNTPGKFGTYDYDIIRSQQQMIPNNTSFTDTNFQIMPYCRLVYIMFLPTWACQDMYQATNKCLSGLSQFPAECTKIKINFAGVSNLICEEFERFGDYDETHQISKFIYFNYLKERKLVKQMEDVFPRVPITRRAVNQAFVIDLKTYMSHKTENLKIMCEYGGGAVSPMNRMMLVISVHPNGRAIVRSSGNSGNANPWSWEFPSRTFNLVE